MKDGVSLGGPGVSLHEQPPLPPLDPPGMGRPATAPLAVAGRRVPSLTGGLAAALAVPTAVIVGLLVLIIYLGFHANGLPSGALTFGNYTSLFGDSAVWGVVRDTVIYVAATLVVSFAF